jgi:hypothetical protein
MSGAVFRHVSDQISAAIDLERALRRPVAAGPLRPKGELEWVDAIPIYAPAALRHGVEIVEG